MNDLLKDVEYRKQVLDFINDLKHQHVEKLEHRKASMLRDVHVALRHYVTLSDQYVRKSTDTTVSN